MLTIETPIIMLCRTQISAPIWILHKKYKKLSRHHNSATLKVFLGYNITLKQKFNILAELQIENKTWFDS